MLTLDVTYKHALAQCSICDIAHSPGMYVCREYSKQLNESRLKVLQARENAVHELIHDAQQSLAGISKDQQKYKTLLSDLLVQVDPPPAKCFVEAIKHATCKCSDAVYDRRRSA